MNPFKFINPALAQTVKLAGALACGAGRMVNCTLSVTIAQGSPGFNVTTKFIVVKL